MLLYNRNRVPEEWGNFGDCYSINNLRGHDGSHDFQLKYPFGTIHFLMATLATVRPITLKAEGVVPLLFTDGTYHNLFRYTENSLDWLRYLQADEPGSPLYRLFAEDRYTLIALMRGMNKFWRARDEIGTAGERGDRVAISVRGQAAATTNLVQGRSGFDLNPNALSRAESFLRLLADATGWDYTPAAWTWRAWRASTFTKESTQSMGGRLNGTTFAKMLARHPLSFAMTSGQNIEYTVEGPDLFG